MSGWKQRVAIEVNKLQDKIARLRAFITSDAFMDLGPRSRSLMRDQLDAMTRYEFILLERIDADGK